MKVLMLGWEFPPHISGGLGTACHGLTRGLAKQGVEVTFVVPRAFGDEDRGPTRILGCNEVPLEWSVPLPAEAAEPDAAAAARPPTAATEAGPDAAGPAAGPRLSGSDGRTAAAPAPELARVLAVDSALLPYLTEAEYGRRLAALAPSGGEARGAPARREGTSGPTGPAAAAAPCAPVEGPAPSAPSGPGAGGESLVRQTLEFSGRYGRDLFAEVVRYAAVVEQVARSEAFDVVHAHDWMTFPAGLAAKRATGRPLVVHVHACEHDRSPDAPNPAVAAVEQEGFDGADRVVCVSHYTAGVLAGRYRIDPAKVRVVHNAVTRGEQREAWRAGKAIDEPIVLFLGRVTYQKGPVYFLEAAARVVRVLPGARFVLCGAGDMLPAVVERAAAMGLARNVRFTGFLSAPEVERLYAMADVYVMPSVSEPFGISPLEAMASDVPVIVSRQSGVAEVLHGALKVDYWDVEDLASKILAVLTRPALRTALVAEGREDLRDMRWEARAALVRKVYEEVAR